MEYRSVYITCKDEAEARSLGRTLVEEKLVACVNYFPVNSLYRWQGQIEASAEAALIAKTRAGLVKAVVDRVRQLHSYQLPCVVSWKIEEGNPAFLDWIGESTRP
jgi:periplasmic divalent cation tolerance protein